MAVNKHIYIYIRFCTYIIPEPACDKLIRAHFPCCQWEVGTREHRPITEKEILGRV